MAVGGKVSGVYYLRVFQYALWSNPQRYQFLQPKYNFESEFIDSWMLQLHTLEQGPNKALSVEVATLLEKNLDRVEFQELLFLIESIGRMKNVDFISLDKIKRSLEFASLNNWGSEEQSLPLCHAWLSAWMRLYPECNNVDFEQSWDQFSGYPQHVCQNIISDQDCLSTFNFQETFYALFICGMFRYTLNSSSITHKMINNCLESPLMDLLTHFEVALFGQFLLRHPKLSLQMLGGEKCKILKELFHHALVTLPDNQQQLEAVKSISQVNGFLNKRTGFKFKDDADLLLQKVHTLLPKIVNVPEKLRLLEMVMLNRPTAKTLRFLDDFVLNIGCQIDQFQRLKDLRILCDVLFHLNYHLRCNNNLFRQVAKTAQKLPKEHYEDLTEYVKLTHLLVMMGVVEATTTAGNIFQSVNTFGPFLRGEDVYKAGMSFFYQSNQRPLLNDKVRERWMISSTLFKIAEMDFTIEINFPGSKRRLSKDLRQKFLQFNASMTHYRLKSFYTNKQMMKCLQEKLINELSDKQVYLGPILPYSEHDCIVLRIDEDSGEIKDLPKEFCEIETDRYQILRPPQLRGSVFLCIYSLPYQRTDLLELKGIETHHIEDMKLLGYKVLTTNLVQVERLNKVVMPFSSTFYQDLLLQTANENIDSQIKVS